MVALGLGKRRLPDLEDRRPLRQGRPLGSFTAGRKETVGTAALISPPLGPTLLYNGGADVCGFRHTSLTGYSAQKVYYSTDTGAIWTASAGLPEHEPVHLGFSIFFFMSPLCSDRVNGKTFYFYD